MSAAKMGLDAKGRMRIKLILPLPPSDNKIYFNLPHGGRELTSVARAYKNTVKQTVAEAAACCPLSFHKHVRYTVVIKVFLEATENAGFEKSKAKDRYKKVDSTNRTKLAIDAVASAVGIDDRHIFKSVILKYEDPDDPRLEIIWREQQKRDIGSCQKI